MILKAIDLSLMTEHLNIHKGILSKLEMYFCAVNDPQLRQTIHEQFLIMRNHVKVMLLLMDDQANEHITSEDLNDIIPVEISCKHPNIRMSQNEIALELRNTAKTMAHDNFSSALRMKADNVRDIHFHMAYQQVLIQQRYSQVINRLQEKEVAPDSSPEEQANTLKVFKQIFNLSKRL